MLYFARWKIALIVIVVAAGILTTLPNFFSQKQLESWPDFLPKSQMVLGLDLRGARISSMKSISRITSKSA